MLRFLIFASLGFLTFNASSQELPKKIRGYTVHRETIVVKTSIDTQDTGRADALVKFGDPVLTDLSLSGVTFELDAEVTATNQSGKVDFLTFNNFRVNGIPVEIEEYAEEFSFEKNKSVRLPKPATVFLPTGRLLQAGWKEMRDSKKEWSITGRVFVFGRFRKLGFYHKRVVPVDIEIKIKNPMFSREK